MNKFIVFLVFLLLVLVSFISAGELRVTEEHPFLINGSWIDASQLKIGDELTLVNGSKVKITKLTDVISNKSFKVYNLEAGEYHNFVVGEEGVVVHNSNNVQTFLGNGGVKVEHLRTNVDVIHINAKFAQGSTRREIVETIRLNEESLVAYIKNHPNTQFIARTANSALTKRFKGLRNVMESQGYSVVQSTYNPHLSEKVGLYVKRVINSRYQYSSRWDSITGTPGNFVKGSFSGGAVLHPSIGDGALVLGGLAIGGYIYGWSANFLSPAVVKNLNIYKIQSLFAEVNGCAMKNRDSSFELYINFDSSFMNQECPGMTNEDLLNACSDVLEASDFSADYRIIPMKLSYFQLDFFPEDLLIKHGLLRSSGKTPFFSCIYQVVL